MAWDDNVGQVLNSSIDTEINLELSSPSSAAGPDSFSYSMIKQLESSVKEPQLIIFQCSLHVNIFPTAWKQAKVFFYKSKGNATAFSSYRPISLCSGLSNLLAKILINQLVSYIYKEKSAKQHSFLNGRLTTFLSCVIFTSELKSRMTAYDIISFDF